MIVVKFQKTIALYYKQKEKFIWNPSPLQLHGSIHIDSLVKATTTLLQCSQIKTAQPHIPTHGLQPLSIISHLTISVEGVLESTHTKKTGGPDEILA